MISSVCVPTGKLLKAEDTIRAEGHDQQCVCTCVPTGKLLKAEDTIRAEGHDQQCVCTNR